MTREEYYEELHELIDSDEYRCSNGVRRLTGEIFGDTAKLEQSFENHYSEKGEYLNSRSVFADGEIVED